jgi:hypothetical protein
VAANLGVAKCLLPRAELFNAFVIRDPLSCPPAVMNLLLNMSRQYTPKGRGTVFLIVNFSYVVGVSWVFSVRL